jgi:hypothetical protein
MAQHTPVSTSDASGITRRRTLTKLTLVLGFCFAILLGTAGTAKADVVFELDVVFENGGGAFGSYVPLVATFQNMGADTVQLTLQANFGVAPPAGTTNPHVKVWTFNVLDSFVDPMGQSLTSGDFMVTSGGALVTSIGVKKDDFKADGDGFFDIEINFDGVNFDQNDTIVIKITDPGLDETDFLSYSVGGDKGAYYSAAHIGGGQGGNSFWVGADDEGGGGQEPGVPAPPAFLLFAVGAVGMGTMTWRRRKAS